MQLFLTLFLAALGLFLIIFGASKFVDSAVWIAKVTKMPELLIGSTIVAIGTTLPEMTVSIMSAASGDSSLAVGNTIGSMLCNIALILGISLSMVYTKVNRKSFMEKFIFMAINGLLLVVFAVNGVVSLYESIILLVMFIIFMFLSIKEAISNKNRILDAEDMAKLKLKLNNQENATLEQNEKADESSENGKTSELPQKGQNKVKAFFDRLNNKPWYMILMFIIGGIGIFFGARLTVDNFSKLAIDYLGISTAVVGFTIVAIGTSLPELVTSVAAIKKNSPTLSLGNVVGANIINGTFLTGICCLIGGGAAGTVIPLDQIAIVFGGIVALFLSILVLLLPIMIKGRTYRAQGVSLLLIYLAYMVFVFIKTFAV